MGQPLGAAHCAHYETTVTGIDTRARTVQVEGEGTVGYDSLIVATGFDYADPGVPGGDLEGLYYVKNIRRAMEWDKLLDSVKRAVVVHATPLGVENDDDERDRRTLLREIGYKL